MLAIWFGLLVVVVVCFEGAEPSSVVTFWEAAIACGFRLSESFCVLGASIDCLWAIESF